jgi:hypothetical protein
MVYMPMDVTRIVLGSAVTFGPVVMLLSLLNRRDRRTSRWRDVVLSQLPWHELRGLVGIQVRSGVLTRRSVVRLDMLACTCDQIWDAVLRLSRVLPPHVRLAVKGTVDRRLTTTFTLATRGKCPLDHRSDPSVVAG